MRVAICGVQGIRGLAYWRVDDFLCFAGVLNVLDMGKPGDGAAVGIEESAGLRRF